MIFADSAADEQAAYDVLLPLQRDDFVGIFQAMDGKPVTVRLLDPPLHEFLPDQVELAVAVALATERGQSQADGGNPIVEIMIPLAATREELSQLREELEPVARQTLAEQGQTLEVVWGTMIELPRAALVAGELAEVAEFFSFGTNDLTQTAFGFSRDDIGKFLGLYEERKLVPANPFVTIDQPGVGRLMRIACEEGRQTRSDLKLGICGEHGGDPDSVRFCHQLGLDYVSCSPFRVPTARLAAGQAALGQATTASK
jgi:pyruvate,orthophosphate dikinase